jgi:hypothetical protein
MVVEAFELLSWCCMATPRSVPLELGAHLFRRPRLRDASQRNVQKGGLPPCGAEIAALKPVRSYSPGIQKTTFCNPSQPLNSERLDLVPKSHCAGTAKQALQRSPHVEWVASALQGGPAT